MTRTGTWRTALLAAIAIGSLVASSVTAQTKPTEVSGLATVSAPAVRSPTTAPDTPGRALLVSDSAWLGFKLYGTMDSVQGFDHTFALASCRRRVSTSCTNFDGFVPITLYEELDDHPDGFTTLIVATGYNDGDQGFSDDVDDIIMLARTHGYERVVWLTLRANVSYQSPGGIGFAEVFERNNAALDAIAEAGTYPELAVADWATFARDRHEWFADDGIHLRTAGGYAAGDYISRKMAFLEEQPCPQPTFAGAQPTIPCPDPDEHGPIIDLESLYPIDQRGPGATFQLSWEGSGSWPDPPWWER